MSLVPLELLILVLIVTDFIIIVYFIVLTRKLKFFNSADSFDKQIKIFESLLVDADKISDSLRKEQKEKHQTIKDFNAKLDKRIAGLKVLLARADTELYSFNKKLVDAAGKGEGDTNKAAVSPVSRGKEIIKLAGKGCNIEKIAGTLSIPREEVKLILDLNKKLDPATDNYGGS